MHVQHAYTYCTHEHAYASMKTVIDILVAIFIILISRLVFNNLSFLFYFLSFELVCATVSYFSV